VGRSGLNGFFGGVIGAALIVVCTAAVTGFAAGSTNLGFTPVTPCRILDTRPDDLRVGVLDTLGPGTSPTVNFAGQCGLPADVAGLSLNVTAVNATVDTYITVWATGTKPLASSLNPAPGQPPTPNAVITPTSANSFKLFNLNGTVDLVIDVNGYFA
jgi:hypothetical protein